MLPMPLAPFVLLAVAVRPLERLGPPAASAGSVCAVTAIRAATASAESTLRVTCLLLIGILCLVREGCGGAGGAGSGPVRGPGAGARCGALLGGGGGTRRTGDPICDPR